MGFAGHLREQTETLWSAIHAHPFVRGIGDGSLPRDVFTFYLQQDYVYLIAFARVLALAGAKARTLDDMRRFGALFALTVDQEMELHRHTCARFGIDAIALEATAPALVTSAYTDFLLHTAHAGPIEDILAVLMPCAAGYVEIASMLRDGAGLPSTPHLREWIETYTSPEMVELVQWLTARVDAMGVEASATSRAHWLALYTSSARHEWRFFDMAWKKEMGPTEDLG